MSDTLRVKQLEWHSEGVFEITFERGGISFTPGDCLALFDEDRKTSRPYSIASGVDDGQLRFIVRRMPGGAVSTYLSRRRPGDPVKASPPFGWFRPGQAADGSPFAFVATGTGISPFMAHFRSRPGQAPAACLLGVRTLADAVHLPWLQRQCDLKLAVSREDAPGHFHGRVTGLLEHLPLAPGSHFYLCGVDAMIDDVSNWLEAHEVPITHIHRECFFNASYASA